jgi:hypothetical protein
VSTLESSASIQGIEHDIEGIWEAGRSVEHLNSLHVEYHDLLRQYDPKVQAAAQGETTSEEAVGRVALATGLNLLVGALTLGGIASLFIRRRSTAL